jgi:hypothetical protein
VGRIVPAELSHEEHDPPSTPPLADASVEGCETIRPSPGRQNGTGRAIAASATKKKFPPRRIAMCVAARGMI